MLTNVKAFIKSVPIIGPHIAHLRTEQFKDSANYWDRRYKTGGNSGAGSYNRLAEFKASVLNEFVRKHEISSVIEYGSGDGAQLKLAQYPTYTGVDISEKALEICRTMFRDDTSKRFLHSKAVTENTTADLALSLDVVYHLVEDSTFDAYMRQLFESAERFVSCTRATWCVNGLSSTCVTGDSPIGSCRTSRNGTCSQPLRMPILGTPPTHSTHPSRTSTFSHYAKFTSRSLLGLAFAFFRCPTRPLADDRRRPIVSSPPRVALTPYGPILFGPFGRLPFGRLLPHSSLTCN